MASKLFGGKTEIGAHAQFLGQNIDLRAFDNTKRLSTSPPLVVPAGNRGCAVLFKYGAVVMFGLDAMEEVSFISDLRLFVTDAFEAPESELAELHLDPKHSEGVRDGIVHLKDFGIERIQLVADVLAKSATISHYEKTIAKSFDRIEPMAAELQKRGRGGRKAREFMSQIGQALVIQGKMIGRVEVEDKPELLWEHPELERLYSRLRDEQELGDRHEVLTKKLDLIYRTAETMMGLLTDKRSLHVEWYITFLIIFEIVLSLWEKLF